MSCTVRVARSTKRLLFARCIGRTPCLQQRQHRQRGRCQEPDHASVSPCRPESSMHRPSGRVGRSLSRRHGPFWARGGGGSRDGLVCPLGGPIPRAVRRRCTILAGQWRQSTSRRGRIDRRGEPAEAGLRGWPSATGGAHRIRLPPIAAAIRFGRVRRFEVLRIAALAEELSDFGKDKAGCARSGVRLSMVGDIAKVFGARLVWVSSACGHFPARGCCKPANGGWRPGRRGVHRTACRATCWKPPRVDA